LWFFLFSLSVFLSFFCCSSRPSTLSLSSCFQFSFHSSTLFSHKCSGGVICKGGLDGSFFTRGGLLQLGLLPALRERKNHLFFLSMYLYLFLNVVSCVLMLSEFNIGYKVFLKVALWKNMLRFRLKGKLTPIFIGPFEILQRIRPVAYKVDLSP